MSPQKTELVSYKWDIRQVGVKQMGCRTNGMSDKWDVGQVGCRTSGKFIFCEKLNSLVRHFVGQVRCRTNETISERLNFVSLVRQLSDNWYVGQVTQLVKK